jgi:RND family efflux transporter MFP subunit
MRHLATQRVEMNKNRTAVNRPSGTAAISMVLTLALSACGPDEAPPLAEVARPVKMMTIGIATGDETLEIPGSVYAAQSAELAFEVAGRMSERLVEEGQVVAAGEVVARMDARDYLARRDRARATRDTTRADYERYSIAYKANAVTEQDVSRAKGQYDVAQADLDVAQKALEDTELRAPFGGRIARRLVDDFANVNAKEAVMILQDESSLELRVDVSERDWVHSDTDIPRDQVTKLINPRVQVASLNDHQFPAYLKEMSASADPVTRTYRVTFGFASPDFANVSPGMTGSVVVDRAKRNNPDTAGMAIPSNLVVADADGNPFVWVIDAASMRVSKRPVELGELSGSNVDVLRGLSIGDKVVASGVNSATPNMLVRDLNKD